MVVKARPCGEADPNKGSLVAFHVDLGSLFLAAFAAPLCYHTLKARALDLVD